MNGKRIIGILLSSTLLLSLLSGCLSTPTGTTEASGATPVSAPGDTLSGESAIEIQTAIDLGLVPEALQRDYGKTIQYDEFCVLMTNVIRLRYGEGEYLEKWMELSALAAKCTDEMTRAGGAEVIFAGAQATEMTDYHASAYTLRDIDGETQGKAIERPHRDDLFPWYFELQHNINWEIDAEWHHLAACYAWRRSSAVSHKPIMEYVTEPTLSMRYGDPFTRKEAICAALRSYEAWTPREYISIEDPLATAYDSSILTLELLSKESSLPQVSHNQLPSDWKGYSIYSKGTTYWDMFDSFHERDIRFLKENGMNYARVYLSFTSLRYPDYPEDGRVVNLSELQDLDQILAWGMEYDVHIAVCMLTPPGFAAIEDHPYCSIGDNRWLEPETWDLIHEYWIMLTKRYSGIPSQKLTFELFTEWDSSEDDHIREFTQRWSEIVSDIREIDPERVLMSSFDPWGVSLAEITASLGISVATHPYYPGPFHSTDTKLRAENGYTQELQWPMVWFPTDGFNENNTPVTLSGQLGGTKLTFYVEAREIYPSETGQPTLTVKGDGKVLGKHTYTAGGAEDGFTLEIPEGTKEVKLTHTGHFLLFCISAEGSFGTSQVMTNNMHGDKNYDAANLVLGADGAWADIDGKLYDKDAFYQIAIAPYLEIAKKYNVGFMVNEFAFANSEEDEVDPAPMDAYFSHYSDCIDLFEECGIGYVLTFASHRTISFLGDYWSEYSMFREYPDYLGWQTYTYDNGLSETFPVNNTLLNLVKSHMK